MLRAMIHRKSVADLTFWFNKKSEHFSQRVCWSREVFWKCSNSRYSSLRGLLSSHRWRVMTWNNGDVVLRNNAFSILRLAVPRLGWDICWVGGFFSWRSNIGLCCRGLWCSTCFLPVQRPLLSRWGSDIVSLRCLNQMGNDMDRVWCYQRTHCQATGMADQVPDTVVNHVITPRQ
jgi:hypothetical protein